METYARRSLERGEMSTLLTNEGRDDVVVLLDRAVGARREGREGRHHDLRHRVPRKYPYPQNFGTFGDTTPGNVSEASFTGPLT